MGPLGIPRKRLAQFCILARYGARLDNAKHLQTGVCACVNWLCRFVRVLFSGALLWLSGPYTWDTYRRLACLHIHALFQPKSYKHFSKLSSCSDGGRTGGGRGGGGCRCYRHWGCHGGREGGREGGNSSNDVMQCADRLPVNILAVLVADTYHQGFS